MSLPEVDGDPSPKKKARRTGPERRLARAIAASEGRCTAHAKSSNRRCARSVEPGLSVCRWHGGMGGAPVTVGRYTQAPVRIRDAFERALADPGLTDLQQGLAFMDALVQERIKRLAEGDSPKWRADMADQVTLVRIAAGSSDAAGLDKAVTRLAELAKQGCDMDEAERSVFALRERLHLRVEEFQRIRLAKGSAVSARDHLAATVLQLKKIRETCEILQLPDKVAETLVLALIEQAGGSPAVGSEFRAELSGAVMEVTARRG